MKIGIRQKTLMEVLEKGSLAAITDDVQSSTPVMSLLSKCVRITVDKNFTVESSSDLLSVKASTPVLDENGIVVKEAGCVLVPAKELMHWAKVQGPESSINISLNRFATPDIINTFDGDTSDAQDMSKYSIRKIGTIKLLSKNASKTSGKWELDCYDPDQPYTVNYEQIGDKCFDIQGSNLIEALDNVSFAAKAKDDHHIQDTISIQVYKDDLYLAATDSLRCALYKSPKEGVSNILLNAPLLINASSLNQISKIINKSEKISVSYSPDTQKIFMSQSNLNVRIVSTDKDKMVKFPSIQRLLEKDYKVLTEVPKEILQELLVSASVVNGSCALFIFNKAEGTFTIKAVSEENKYKPCIKQSAIPNIDRDAKAVWGVKHLSEGLKVIKAENVTIALPDNMKSARITGRDDMNLNYFIMVMDNIPYYRGVDS